MKNPRYGVSADPSTPKFIDVPCGKCPSCLARKRREWFARLSFEAACHQQSLFVTLTYNDENLPKDENGNPTFSKVHIQKYFKRVRKRLPDTVRLRYFLVSEYGEQFSRPHYHAIFFGMSFDPEIVNILTSEWKYGFVRIDPANDRRLNYCCKYVLFKSECPEGRMKPFLMASKRPLLGSDFFDLRELNGSILEDLISLCRVALIGSNYPVSYENASLLMEVMPDTLKLLEVELLKIPFTEMKKLKKLCRIVLVLDLMLKIQYKETIEPLSII